MLRRRLNRRQFLAASAGVCVFPALLSAADKNQEVAWLAEVQTPPAKLPNDAPQLEPLLKNAAGQPIATVAEWQERRDELRRWWREFLGEVPVQRDEPPPLTVLAEDRDAGVIRRRVRYDVEPGVATEAYVLEPEGTARCPGAAVFHSTVNHSIRQPAGLADDREKAFGLELARRGFVTISPRNFLWPDNEHIDANGETKRFQVRRPGVTGMAKMLFDAQVAVDILARLPRVDSARLCAVGHSLGAKEVLYLAAFDERIKVTVSSEGGVGTKFSNWDAPWYLGPRIQQPDFTHEHHELLALIAPRPFLLVGGDSADGDRGWPFIEAALPVYRLFGEPARLGQFNHKQGHSVPPEAERRIYEWIETYH